MTICDEDMEIWLIQPYCLNFAEIEIQPICILITHTYIAHKLINPHNYFVLALYVFSVSFILGLDYFYKHQAIALDR